MSDGVKTRLDFLSPFIQVQTVRNLVGAVLKEKGSQGPLTQSSPHGPAWESLWEQCCSDRAVVVSACCEALVLMVEQQHADLHYVLTCVLNLLPSARSVQGLVRLMGRLLWMQAEQGEPAADGSCPYSIRTCPHPFITALENRADCWSALLLQIDDLMQEAVERNNIAHVAMLFPFLRYLYCDPQRRPQQAVLRHSLLGVLLPRDQEPSAVCDALLLCMCQLLPHMQVDSLEAGLELCGLVDILLPCLLRTSGDSWKRQKVQVLLQLLSVCHTCLQSNGDCRPVLKLMQQLLPSCQQDGPHEELLMGVALLLLDAPGAQQSGLLSLVLTLVPEEAELRPWLSPVLVLPVLQILYCSSVTEVLCEQRTHRARQNMAHSVLRRVSSSPNKPRESVLGISPSQPTSSLTVPVSHWFGELSAALSVLHTLLPRPAAAASWLQAVSCSLRSRLPSTRCLTLIVAQLILTAQQDVCLLALETAAAIAAAEPSQVPSLVPVLLFKLSSEKDPSLTAALLTCLPRLGTHKLCVPMILHTLHALASAPRLKSVALRLMSCLWKRQDRVYTELQRLLTQHNSSVVTGKDAEWEQLLARAACIRDICRERPYQHGGDMLAAITHTLQQCDSADLAAPATLVLQGLQELVRAEVVDIVSTWRSLGPSLSSDSRPMVVRAVAGLLALVPELSVSSEEYQKLKEEVVSTLWTLTASKDPEVVCCGYKALACFPEDAHTITHLPEAARPIETLSDPEEDGEQPDDQKEEKVQSIPGSSYAKLLTLTSPAACPALELLLTSLVKQEMEQMPRGVFFSAMRASGLRSDQGKPLAGIPAFMVKTYQRNTQPGLKPGLAAGMLLCYDVPVQTDREGQPISRFLVSRSRSFQQTLAALLHEVNIQPSEWHHALFLPPAWRAFMGRAFHAVLQGRRADLEVQQKKHKDDSEELQHKHHCAWLWTRDQLTEAIKTSTRDAPVVQGNSILALSGLAAVAAKYESSLPAESHSSRAAGAECVSTSSWLSTVLDTLLSVISSSHQPSGPVLPWLLHRSYSGENTASAIARSCACTAVSLLVPQLVERRMDRVEQILLTLQDNLPGSSSSSDHAQVLHFHSGLALGMVLSSVFHQRLSDVSALTGSDLLTSGLERLERSSFDPDLEHRSGCLLGLGLVLAALCSDGCTDRQEHILGTLDKMLSSLQDGSEQGRLLQEVLAYSCACVGLSAFSAGLVQADKAEEVMNSLRVLTEERQQTPGFSLALGLAVDGLSACGHGRAEDLHPRLLAAWIQILLAEGCPITQRLAALNGLVALVGSERYLVQSTTLSSQQQSRLNEVIRAITQVVGLSGAIGLQSNCACLVAHLHLAHMSTSHSYTTVPQDFHYLSQRSIIRALTDFITEAGRNGPEVFLPVMLRTALGPLASVGACRQFPPINWSSTLTPVMRLSFGEEVQCACVSLCVSQAQWSQSASQFLGCWMSPPLVHSLSVQSRRCLYEGLGLWMKHVAQDKLQLFLDTLGLQLFQEKLPLCGSVLKGLAAAMALPDPPSSCWTILCSTTEKIFKLLPDTIQDGDVPLYVGIARCLSEMSDTEIDRITHVTEAQMEKCGFVLAYLTSQGRLPLLCLNDVITGVLRGGPSPRLSWMFCHTFYQCRLAASAHTGVSRRMEWLLELMGHMRKVVYGSVSVTWNVPKATDFLFQLFAAAVVSWADHSMPLLLGLRAQWFPWKLDAKPPALTHRLYGDELLAEHTVPQCMLGLPCSLPLLLQKEPWCSQTQQFMDWLFSITEGPKHSLSECTINTAKASLLSLKSCVDFQRKAVWSRVCGW